VDFDDARTVHGDDLRRLLDSELPDATLMMVAGSLTVVAGDDRAASGLEVISRRQLLDRLGDAEPTGDELDRQAANVSVAVDNLGG
jgi:hypothetical protein